MPESDSDSDLLWNMERNKAQQKRRRDQRGDRQTVTMRPPVELKATLEAAASELGMPLGSWALYELCKARGFEIPQFVLDDYAAGVAARKADKEELQLRIA